MTILHEPMVMFVVKDFVLKEYILSFCHGKSLYITHIFGKYCLDLFFPTLSKSECIHSYVVTYYIMSIPDQ